MPGVLRRCRGADEEGAVELGGGVDFHCAADAADDGVLVVVAEGKRVLDGVEENPVVDVGRGEVLATQRGVEGPDEIRKIGRAEDVDRLVADEREHDFALVGVAGRGEVHIEAFGRVVRRVGEDERLLDLEPAVLDFPAEPVEAAGRGIAAGADAAAFDAQRLAAQVEGSEDGHGVHGGVRRHCDVRGEHIVQDVGAREPLLH